MNAGIRWRASVQPDSRAAREPSPCARGAPLRGSRLLRSRASSHASSRASSRASSAFPLWPRLAPRLRPAPRSRSRSSPRRAVRRRWAAKRAPRPAPAPARARVVVVSIDGMKPETYLEPDRLGLAVPTLRSIVARGAHARAVESVFPSVTYPAHTTLVTGAPPRVHGIVSNRPPRSAARRTWTAGAGTPRTSQCRRCTPRSRRRAAPPRSSPGRSPSVRRPRSSSPSTGAPATPTIRSSCAASRRRASSRRSPAPTPICGSTSRRPRSRTRRSSRSRSTSSRRSTPTWCSPRLGDRRRAARARPRQPRGPARLRARRPPARRAARHARALARLGPHDARRGLRPRLRARRPRDRLNALFRERGLVTTDADGKATAARAAPIENGGTAYIYLLDPAAGPDVRAALETIKPAIGKIYSRDEILAAGGDPAAALAVGAAPGYSFTDRATGPAIADRPGRGHHGLPPTDPAMAASFLAIGPRIAHRDLGAIRMIDIGADDRRLARHHADRRHRRADPRPLSPLAPPAAAAVTARTPASGPARASDGARARSRSARACPSRSTRRRRAPSRTAARGRARACRARS